ncbi:urea ABC transporter ATP-binding protein [Abditibacterium utsteinense]|uniref:Urea ABC transporter ATP-binding protein n=1 Tax=Abditibacterium utsteinense TaxID=1960156 RepID=A0A2S8SWK9_9BACT|nr:urea ABC transporter ATP-binding protein UrtD [Abditibacterium utsteinense]PQV65196.1 urea ABC transporter ATP-binding protein [Abditibacterium utsteinense]
MLQLQTENLTVSFDGFKAVDDVQFSMGVGEVRFLIGPNGAGKTTLLDAICGRIKPTSGKVWFKEFEIQRQSEHEIAQSGIGRKFQAPSVFGALTVRQNLEIAAKAPRGVWANVLGKSRANQEKLNSVLGQIGLEDKAGELAGNLAHGAKQWLEIGMLLMQEAELLLFDEPAAGMTDAETDKMGQLLLDLARTKSVLVVEHDMEFVRRYASKVTVMHAGKIISQGTMEHVSNDPLVAEVYLARRAER